MKKLIYTLFVLFYFSTISGQIFSRLTDYQNREYLPNFKRIINFEDKPLLLLINDDFQLEVWDFEDESSKMIYTTDIDFCNGEFRYIAYNDSLLFTIYTNKIEIYNVFNSKSEERIIPDEINSIYGGMLNTAYEEVRNGLIILDKKYSYDILLDEFVPSVFTDECVYRSNSYYYTIRYHEYYLNKRAFRDTAKSSITDVPINKSYNVIDNVLYFSDSTQTLTTIDENDQIKTNKIAINSESIFKINDNYIGVLGEKEDQKYVYTINKNDLSIFDLFQISDSENFKFLNYNNNKFYFAANNNIYYYNYITKSLGEIEKNFYVNAAFDSLVFSKVNNQLVVLNLYSFQKKQLYDSYQEYSIIYSSIHNFNNKYYLHLMKKDVGLTLVQYDFNSNSLIETKYNLTKNKGLNYDMYVGESVLYFGDIRSAEKIQIFNIKNENKLSEIRFSRNRYDKLIKYKDKIYYFYKNKDLYNKDSICLSLMRYDLNTNQEKTILDNIYVNKRRFIKTSLKNHYLILKKPNNEFKILDVNVDKFIDIPEFNEILFVNVKLVTDDYFFSSLHNDGLYQVSKEAPFHYTKIFDSDSYKLYSLKDNEFVLISGASFYYFNGTSLEKITEEEGINSIAKTTYNNKFFIKYFKKNIDDNYFVFDRTTKQTNVFNLNSVVKSDQIFHVKLLDDRLLVSGKSIDDKYFLVSYNLLSDERAIKYFENKFNFVSISTDEIHLALKDKIIVLDIDLNEIDSLDDTRFYENFIFNINSDFNICQSMNNNLLIYDRQKREINSYFDCEDSLRLCRRPVVRDNIVYCMAYNDAHGMQLYSSNLGNITNVDDSFSYNLRGVKVYPNPSKDLIFFEKPVKGYIIFNIKGDIMKLSSSKTDRIDISNFASGVYFIRSENKQGVAVGKFVKIESILY